MVNLLHISLDQSMGTVAVNLWHISLDHKKGYADSALILV